MTGQVLMVSLSQRVAVEITHRGRCLLAFLVKLVIYPTDINSSDANSISPNNIALYLQVQLKSGTSASSSEYLEGTRISK